MKLKANGKEIFKFYVQEIFQKKKLRNVFNDKYKYL